ncbi:hypothetical protein T265_01333 [Opisthorchis viverrini]|uniref:Uncharacterized protein n=1 Tax=Opisthorchis viverrini TaxID=6198 RepID=A0A075A014_OPIVI|nr:hypothetical protein T265_01333 [Opisthorchis viverrini]KER32646.1 hypothetical protein T265_01333 [Opisthorchis viverrini]
MNAQVWMTKSGRSTLPLAMRSYLPLPQTIGERNCGSYNHSTKSTRLLQLTMMMMMISGQCELPTQTLTLSYLETTYHKTVVDSVGPYGYQLPMESLS